MGFLFADKAQHIHGLKIKSIHQPAPFSKTKNPLKNNKKAKPKMKTTTMTTVPLNLVLEVDELGSRSLDIFQQQVNYNKNIKEIINQSNR
jgi:hypothetical protein